MIISEDFDGAATVPVPATILLFSTGLAGLVGLRIERKNK
ncbi:MAG: PEP-CTERM sorting domain-containing protein [Deltaproteobacteria bacterium]|nr:PEP-CTERM sorting domain-containing protein [Deltaproteobacteria bacterium]